MRRSWQEAGRRGAVGLAAVALIGIAASPAAAGRIVAKKRTTGQSLAGGDVLALALTDGGSRKLRVTTTGTTALAIMLNASCRVDTSSNTDLPLTLGITVDGTPVEPANRVLCRSGVGDSIQNGSARASYNVFTTVSAGSHVIRAVVDFSCCGSSSHATIDDLSLIIMTGDP